MSDDYDYYQQEEDVIEYDGDYYDQVQNEDMGINFEDMFIEAENSGDVNKFKEIIETERDMSSNCLWSFKSYEKMCLIYIKNKNLEEFQKCFDKLVDLYGKVDDFYKQDTIRNCGYQLFDIHDNEFSIQIFRYMLDMLKEKSVDREVMNTGLQFAKILFSLGLNDDLGVLLDELLYYMARLDQNDEIYKSIKLELLVMKIQYCNILKNTKESKKIYIEAETLNKDKIIDDKRLSAIINEEGEKLLCSRKIMTWHLKSLKQLFIITRKPETLELRLF